jgi:hypothetical protein
MKVEKGIPLPRRFPFDQMEVGDSFAVPPDVHRTTVSIAALRYGRKHGMTFVTRMVADRTLRCWRVT